ncbi:MAG: hypothetical protein IJH82_11495 [Lachnospiraceae bacterium]|nr:hypothetical protein [Lachnospiraceae bacterium]
MERNFVSQKPFITVYLLFVLYNKKSRFKSGFDVLLVITMENRQFFRESGKFSVEANAASRYSPATVEYE